MTKLTRQEKLSSIDNKFMRKMEKVLRYNPAPLSMEEPFNGEAVSPELVAATQDRHFVRVLRTVGIYNAMMVKYENHIWQFLFRFSDDYRVVVNVPKHVGPKEVRIFESAARYATEFAVDQHEKSLLNKEEEHKQRVEDIVYDQ